MRFFLDNCLSPRQAKALHELSSFAGHTVHHLSDQFARDTPDDKWLPDLSRQSNWIVVSGDMRIFKSPQLRTIWVESRLTTFFLRKGWTNLKFWEQSWWLVRWWPVIIEQAERVEPGAGFEVPPMSTGKFRLLNPPA